MQIIIKKDKLLKLANIPTISLGMKIDDKIDIFVSSELFQSHPSSYYAYLCFILPNKKSVNKLVELTNEMRNSDYVLRSNFDPSITALQGKVNIRMEFIDKISGSIIRSSSQNISVMPNNVNYDAMVSTVNFENQSSVETIPPMMVANGFSLDSPVFLGEFTSEHEVYHMITDSNPPVEIVDREIIMAGVKNIAIVGDNRSQILSFRINRYLDNVDLAEKRIIIKFINVKNYGDWSIAVNKEVEDDYITFGWLIDERVTVAKGKVPFGVDFVGEDEYGEPYLARTKPASITVEDGLDVDRQIEDFYPLVLQTLEIRVNSLESGGIANLDEIINQKLNENLQHVDIKFGSF